MSGIGVTVNIGVSEQITLEVNEPAPSAVGVPAGGLTGQSLVKLSDANFDTEWATVSGGGVPADTYVLKSGDTLTGFLNLHANPTAALHPATKQYVDSLPAPAHNHDSSYLPKSGGSMSGALLAAPGTQPLPGISFAGDTDTGLSSTADLISVSAGGSLVAQFGNSAAGFGTRLIAPSTTTPALRISVLASQTARMVEAYNSFGQLAMGIASGGAVENADGNAAAPSVRFLNDPNTGIFSSAADEIGMSTGGVKRVTVSNTGFASTVPVVLPSDPTLPLQAATKQYVDNNIGGGSSFDPLFSYGTQVKVQKKTIADDGVPSDGWYLPGDSSPAVLTGRLCSLTWEGPEADIPAPGTSATNFRDGDTGQGY